jgi:hypothetical protein
MPVPTVGVVLLIPAPKAPVLWELDIFFLPGDSPFRRY